MDEARAPSKKKIKLMHVFKHPKFYRIPRDKAISPKQSTDRGGRAPTNLSDKQQASSSKPQAFEPTQLSDKQQASSSKPQATSSKRQATSD
jgi:hypothetical protein